MLLRSNCDPEGLAEIQTKTFVWEIEEGMKEHLPVLFMGVNCDKGVSKDESS